MIMPESLELSEGEEYGVEDWGNGMWRLVCKSITAVFAISKFRNEHPELTITAMFMESHLGLPGWYRVVLSVEPK